MAIGEFGGAPDISTEGGFVASSPMYWLYEMSHAALNPSRALADATKLFYKNPVNPLSHTTFGKSIAAAAELFERSTRRYSKPEWGITSALVGGERVPVNIVPVWEGPFCRLLHFSRAMEHAPRRPQPKMLIVAPMSGHYATLLRGTVEAFLPNHDVYITDWADARSVPVAGGRFDLDDYIDYVISILHFLGGDTHVIAVCQPSVPVLAAVALMEANEDPYVPSSMTLMGGPIDTREAPTAVNTLATKRPFAWFERNVIATVPMSYPGAGRKVYPGFLQLAGFMSMNLGNHMISHWEMFKHLVQGDDDSADLTKDFYEEYRSVCDMTSEFYLQTIEVVFQKHAIANGTYTHRGRPVDPSSITDIALLAIEGERDDISGLGQTKAALSLANKLPASQKKYLMAKGAGHYGIFNGSKWRNTIAPAVEAWISAHAG